MKKILKKINIIMCVFALTIGFIGMNTNSADAASKTYKCSINISLGAPAGAIASKSQSYTIKFVPSNGKATTLGKATYSLGKYKLSGKTNLTFVDNKAGSAKFTITGKDAMGKTRTWSTTCKTVKVGKRTFNVKGYVDAPKLSVS